MDKLPFGYKKDDNEIIVDTYQAKIIELIFYLKSYNNNLKLQQFNIYLDTDEIAYLLNKFNLSKSTEQNKDFDTTKEQVLQLVNEHHSKIVKLISDLENDGLNEKEIKNYLIEFKPKIYEEVNFDDLNKLTPRN